VKSKDESNPTCEIMSAGFTFLAQIKAKPAMLIG
jgi:hypothetical protein